MKAFITFDENNYISRLITNSEGDYELDDDFNFEYLYCYHLANGKLILDKSKVREQKQKEEDDFLIAKYQKELAETDYKIIKCYEYQLSHLELPYDIETLHQQRQALRDKINELGGEHEITE